MSDKENDKERSDATLANSAQDSAEEVEEFNQAIKEDRERFPNTKVCTKCKLPKSLDEFASTSGGYWCKACRKQYVKNWLESDPERKAAYRKKARDAYQVQKEILNNSAIAIEAVQHARRMVNRERKMKVLKHYGGEVPRCACCNEAHVEFLTIDHMMGNGTLHRKEIGNALYVWLIRNGFPPGFQVLCANCNFSKGHYGYCPHSGYSERYQK